MSDPCPDPVVERVVDLLRSRSTVGVRKYGSTLDAAPLTRLDFLRHLLEELLDAANYTQKQIDLERTAPTASLPPPPEPQALPRVPGYPPGW